MQGIRVFILLSGLCLAFAGGSPAEVVTQPLRKFGLGDLLQVTLSPNGHWMAPLDQVARLKLVERGFDTSSIFWSSKVCAFLCGS